MSGRLLEWGSLSALALMAAGGAAYFVDHGKGPLPALGWFTGMLLLVAPLVLRRMGSPRAAGKRFAVLLAAAVAAISTLALVQAGPEYWPGALLIIAALAIVAFGLGATAGILGGLFPRKRVGPKAPVSDALAWSLTVCGLLTFLAGVFVFPFPAPGLAGVVAPAISLLFLGTAAWVAWGKGQSTSPGQP
ncbi:MAG TPA: hypothetical protein VM286_05550 [Candidatus Thermoplasmatota archaeon]|nr:hypothetical protein [Candidatus Thermoplasmatota archaeon]